MSTVIDGTNGVILPATNIDYSNVILPAGELQYSNTALFFGTNSTIGSGLVPSQFMYNVFSGSYTGAGGTTFQGANTIGAQSVFPPMTTGFTLTPNTVYSYESQLILAKTSGTTSHTISLGFNGTANTNCSVGIFCQEVELTGTYGALGSSGTQHQTVLTGPALTVVTGALTATNQMVYVTMKGTVTIYGSNTVNLLPVYSLSANIAAANAYWTQIGSYVNMYPISEWVNRIYYPAVSVGSVS